MLQDEQLIIDSLGIATWPEEQKRPVINEATYRLGQAITGDLSEQQYNEYKAIVDDDHEVIDAWLDQNVPEYKNSPVYQEIEASYETDPEKNNPNKIFASIAWMQVNVPDLKEKIMGTLHAYKQELSKTA